MFQPFIDMKSIYGLEKSIIMNLTLHNWELEDSTLTYWYDKIEYTVLLILVHLNGPYLTQIQINIVYVNIHLNFYSYQINSLSMGDKNR